MDLSTFTLSPMVATILFCVSCVAGVRYRQVWKAEGPRYQYWLFGGIAAVGLLALGFVPIEAAS